MTKSFLIALLFASTCAVAAPTTKSPTPTFSVEGLQSVPLPQPLFYKAVYVSRTGAQQVYYGLANRLVLGRTNGQTPPPLPADYSPAFMFTGSTKATLVYLNDVQRIDITGLRQASLTLKHGEKTTVEAWNNDFAMPTEACAPGQTQFLTTNCQSAYLAGALLDDSNDSSFSDTSLSLHKSFQSVEFIEGPQAVTAFKAATAEFEKHRKAERVAVAAADDAAKAWRASLKEGSATSCGMVIERKKDIANIQMNSGTHWIRVDQLKQVGGLCYY